MKTFPVLLLIVFLGCNQEQTEYIYSNKSKIEVYVNGNSSEWRVDPEVNPDRKRVFCAKDKNDVVFITDLDTAHFTISKNDTIRFNIILNSSDTAKTELIGIWDLPNNITNDEKLYWFSQIWSEVKYNFVNIDMLDFNLDSLYKAMIPEALESANDFEYYRILKKFLASLGDGHTEVSSVGQFYHYTDYIPITFNDFNKKVYITLVGKIHGLDSTWVGAELIEIEGLPTIQYLETEIFPYISASTEQHLWMQGIHKIHSDLRYHPFRGTIKKMDGNIEKIEIERNGEATRTKEDAYWGPDRNFSINLVDISWLENNIALVAFNRFSPEEKAIEEFNEVLKELKKAKGVIIDLRKNGGGSTAVAWHLQKHLTMESQFLNYAWETRINNGVFKANGNWKDEYKDYFLSKALQYEQPEVVQVSDTINRINCPTVILIGRYTLSAAEDFLVNLYEVPDRPKLIGEETGGSTGSPLIVRGLPGGGYARICTRRICYPVSGKRFVNSGIKPDIDIKQTIEDYLNNKDVVLEKAIEEINSSIY